MKANVSDGGETPEALDLTNTVKQDVVFSRFLAATLEEAFCDIEDGVYIQ